LALTEFLLGGSIGTADAINAGEARTLIDRESQLVKLAKRCDWLGAQLWWPYACLVLRLWLVSLNNIRKVRNSMGF